MIVHHQHQQIFIIYFNISLDYQLRTTNLLFNFMAVCRCHTISIHNINDKSIALTNTILTVYVISSFEHRRVNYFYLISLSFLNIKLITFFTILTARGLVVIIGSSAK